MRKDDIAKNIKVSEGNNITVPDSNINLLGLSGGDYISFAEKDGRIFVENTAVYAMKILQDNMADVHMNNNEVIELIKELRNQ
ncbi:MAG: hypothetical protein ACI4WM_01590 [Erysipelotrichaceae bacterium]